MDAPKSSAEKIQNNNLPAGIGEDKMDSVTTGTDGTNERLLNTMPVATSFLKLLPEVSVGANMSTSAKPNDPVIELRVQRANTSRDELDDEALELMEILRDCIFNTSELTGFLAGHPDVIAPYQNDISMLDATAGFLNTMLGPASNHRSGSSPTAEQALRRIEIRDRLYRGIKQMRRIPCEVKEVDYSSQGGPGSMQKEKAANLSAQQDINTSRSKVLLYKLPGVMKFQLDGADQEGAGSTQEEQDQLKIDGSDQGASRTSQGN